jgi:hypothetical protein
MLVALCRELALKRRNLIVARRVVLTGRAVSVIQKLVGFVGHISRRIYHRGNLISDI